jgi:hypothetical protein
MTTLTHVHTFENLRDEVSNRLNEWISANMPLFKTDVTKDLLWETYLYSFPIEEQQSHNCNTCRQFIKACGDIVMIDSNLHTHTIWDTAVEELGDSIQGKVAAAMRDVVLWGNIDRPFYTSERKYGAHHNQARQEDGTVITWNHFYMEIKAPTRTRAAIYLTDSVGGANGAAQAKYQVFRRSLEEITPEAAQTVLELINQKSLYRGEEYRRSVEQFIALQNSYLLIPEEAVLKRNRWLWMQIGNNTFTTIRNTVIGTLLTDISTGVELDKAVFAFENKMDPTRFKRPRAVYTESSLTAAKKTLEELGLLESLRRRYATSQDLTVNNVLYVNRAQAAGDIFTELAAEAPVSIRSFSKVQEIPLQDFIVNVLPGASKVELYLEERLTSNLMTLVAPANVDAPTFIKWDNGLTWSYKGAVADSIVERVKQAGGQVTGVLRCSLGWENLDDLDLHLRHRDPRTNKETEIYFGHKSDIGGTLDVDSNVNFPKRGAVENIIFANKLPVGDYTVIVNNFTRRENNDQGFTIEIEYGGETYVWSSNTNEVRHKAICKFMVKEDYKLIFNTPPTDEREVRSKEVWGLKTNTFHNVHTLTRSPNAWDDPQGNLHYFFLLDKVEPEEAARPFLNEFIKESLLQHHRRVFEVLGGRVTVEGKPELSGLGFSTTKPNHFYCRVTSAFSRILKVIV